MKEALFYTFLGIFVVTAIVTLLGVTNKITIKDRFLNALFASLLIELVVAMIALFKSADFFGDDGFQRYVKPNQQEYIWNEANIRFSYPRVGWSIDTKRKEGGLGDLALVSTSSISSQIQLHVSALDSKYVNDWNKFLDETKKLWHQTISPHGSVTTDDIYIDGFKGFRLNGTIPGSASIPKTVDVVYVPISNEFFIEIHYTRNKDSDQPTMDESYEIVLSTLLVEK